MDKIENDQAHICSKLWQDQRLEYAVQAALLRFNFSIHTYECISRTGLSKMWAEFPTKENMKEQVEWVVILFKLKTHPQGRLSPRARRGFFGTVFALQASVFHQLESEIYLK